jgi:DNA-binding XRE family transcriptional regulator
MSRADMAAHLGVRADTLARLEAGRDRVLPKHLAAAERLQARFNQTTYRIGVRLSTHKALQLAAALEDEALMNG